MEYSTREWTIKALKVGNEWSNDYGTYQSYSLALDGIGEPVQLNKKKPVKYEPKIGDKLYGSLEEKFGKEGRIYYKFNSEAKPQQQASLPNLEKKEWQARDDNAIRAQWAIGQAVSTLTPTDKAKVLNLEYVERMAKDFYAMVDRVKRSESLKAEAPVTKEQVQELVEETTFSDMLKEKYAGEEINLDEIPF